MNINKNFVGAKMNKSLDERVVPKGEYIDALNIRVSSDEDGEAFSIENAKGNERITTLEYNGTVIDDAVCIGAYEDGANETIYWFVTSPSTVDMIVSYNEGNNVLRYHVISTDVLNFNELAHINGINLIDNLLFWTDNINPPRRINVDSSYIEPTEDDISVIVKPPTEAPVVELFSVPTEENYMEDKFISFSYRYKYKDGEYSSLSEFSSIAFAPGDFDIDYSNYEMIGMLNIYNMAKVSFNTGSQNVVGIDVCYKLSDSTIINVIEKFDKEEQGWNDNEIEHLEFDNKKIYTTLLEAE